MTYREALANCLEKSEDGMITGSFALTWFTFAMADILAYCCKELAEKDFPTASIEGEYLGGGKANEATWEEIHNILAHGDFLRSLNLSQQLIGFYDYLLDCDIPDDDDDIEGDWVVWYDFEILIDHWNEYANKNSKQ